MPSPAIRMPVCPVARNVAFAPSSVSVLVSASAVYFFPSAIGADGRHAHARSLAPGRGGDRQVGMPDVHKAHALGRRRAHQRRKRREARMHAAHHVQPGVDRVLEIGQPYLRQLAPHERDSDHDAAGAARRRFRGRQARHAYRDGRRRHAPLADYVGAAPVPETEGCLGIERIARVAEVEQVGLSESLQAGGVLGNQMSANRRAGRSNAAVVHERRQAGGSMTPRTHAIKWPVQAYAWLVGRSRWSVPSRLPKVSRAALRARLRRWAVCPNALAETPDAAVRTHANRG